MTEVHASVEVEDGQAGAPVQRGLSPQAVASIILGRRGQSDVTVTVTRDYSDDRLMVAISGSRAFVGLQRPDGVFQFVPDPHDGGSTAFSIGGQEADISNRYLPSVETAASVVAEWLTRGEDSSRGHWERQ